MEAEKLLKLVEKYESLIYETADKSEAKRS